MNSEIWRQVTVVGTAPESLSFTVSPASELLCGLEQITSPLLYFCFLVNIFVCLSVWFLEQLLCVCRVPASMEAQHQTE